MNEVLFQNWGRNKITPLTALVRPFKRISSIAVHFKADGAADDTPSLAFECKDIDTNVYVHEISFNTLKKCLEKAGYTICQQN